MLLLLGVYYFDTTSGSLPWYQVWLPSDSHIKSHEVFPTRLISVSEPRTINLYIFGTEKFVKLSNKIDQGIRTQNN